MLPHWTDIASYPAGGQVGSYSLGLLVGDPGIAPAISWYPLADVEVAFKDGLPEPALTTAERAFQPKLPILHMHRQPEQRPPAVLSLAFAGLTLAPLLLVLVGLVSNGANIKV